MKSCPFCNSANVMASHNKKATKYYVECKSCGAKGPVSKAGENCYQAGYAFARDEWNKRNDS